MGGVTNVNDIELLLDNVAGPDNGAREDPPGGEEGKASGVDGEDLATGLGGQ